MKKFLVFLFITISTSAVVKFDVDLENLLTAASKRFWDWFEKALDWIKSSEYYAKIVDLLKSAGKPAAVELCKNVLPIPLVSSTICEEVIDYILKALDSL